MNIAWWHRFSAGLCPRTANQREHGHVAGQRLPDAIDGRSAAAVRKLPCTLVLRGSSRPRRESART